MSDFARHLYTKQSCPRKRTCMMMKMKMMMMRRRWCLLVLGVFISPRIDNPRRTDTMVANSVPITMSFRSTTRGESAAVIGSMFNGRQSSRATTSVPWHGRRTDMTNRERGKMLSTGPRTIDRTTACVGYRMTNDAIASCGLQPKHALLASVPILLQSHIASRETERERELFSVRRGPRTESWDRRWGPIINHEFAKSGRGPPQTSWLDLDPVIPFNFTFGLFLSQNRFSRRLIERCPLAESLPLFFHALFTLPISPRRLGENQALAMTFECPPEYEVKRSPQANLGFLQTLSNWLPLGEGKDVKWLESILFKEDKDTGEIRNARYASTDMLK